MKELTILLAGSGRGHIHYHCETWTVNDTYKYAKRVDKHFLFHKQIYRLFDNEPVFNWKEMNKLPCVITTHEIAELKNREPYPLNEIISLLETDFLGHSGAYLLAYACYLKVTDNAYDQIYLDNWYFQASGENSATDGRFVEYWIGYAKGLGIKIWLPPQSWLCKTWHSVPYAMAYETQV